MNEIQAASKSIKVIITVSLLLNAFLLGVLFMCLVNKSAKHNGMRRGMRIHSHERMPPRIAEKMKVFRESNRERFMKLHTAREEILDVIASDEFDAALYEAKVKQVDLVREDVFKEMSADIQKLVVESSPEDRKLVAEFLRRHKRSEMKRWRHQHDR